MSKNLSNGYIAGLNPSMFDKVLKSKRAPSCGSGRDKGLAATNKPQEKTKLELTSPIFQKYQNILSSDLNRSLIKEHYQPRPEPSNFYNRRKSEISSEPFLSPTHETISWGSKKSVKKDLSLDLVFKNKGNYKVSNSSAEKISDNQSTPKSKDSPTVSEKSEFTQKSKNFTESCPDILINNEKYGTYEYLSKLYETERNNRQHFENMYSNVYNENKELRNTVNLLRNENNRLEMDDKCESIIERLQNEIVELENTVQELRIKNYEADCKRDDERVLGQLRTENEELRSILNDLKVQLETESKLVKTLKIENETLKKAGIQIRALQIENENLKNDQKLVKTLQIENESLKSTERLVKSLQTENEALKGAEKHLKTLQQENKSLKTSLGSLKSPRPTPEPDSISSKLIISLKGEVAPPLTPETQIKSLQQENQDLKSRLEDLSRKYSKQSEEIAKANDEKSKKKIRKLFSNEGFLKDSVESLKTKGIDEFTSKAESMFSENEELRSIINKLRSELETSKHQEEIKNLQKELDQVKTISEKEKGKLLVEINGLRRGNKDISNKLRQKIREFDHYECHTLLKHSATKIPSNDLVIMDKDELLNQFNFLKTEYTELSKKILSQADEMFEKKNEIKELNRWKTSLCKEIEVLKEQNIELGELKEHVAYLFNTIQYMKEKIKKLGEMYKESVKKEENKESVDFVTSMKLISEIMKTNIHTFAEKKRKRMNWVDENGKKNLVEHLKHSLLNFVKR